ncbi:MAG: hypothetical protein COB42_01815 [Sulfurimonas sp.]|nr:MAG: hypothetical protein COB42_01815 [Sulfurimonas sp.]
MWSISNLINNTSPVENINFSDGQAINVVRGPKGASFRLIINGFGFLDFTDTGHQPSGPHYWQLVINRNIYWYDGQGAINLTINYDGSYTVTGDGNNFFGTLIPFPVLSERDIINFNWMIKNNYIPYQNIQDEPGKTIDEIKKLGVQYFPSFVYSFELAMSLYDWTTANFTRIDFLRLFTYTGVKNNPLDMDSISNGIWTANWAPYTPSNKDYMNSFMMVPARSLQDVQQQLKEKENILYSNNLSEINIITVALQSMPKTSCISIVKLYSGQVAISNLGSVHFATYFLELPADSDSSLPSLQMPLVEALDSFIAEDKVITLKSFMSFTDSYEDAKHYSNGIVIIVAPADGAVIWDRVTYITPLSDGPDKIEYLFQIDTQFKVLKTKTVLNKEKTLVEIYLQIINESA